MLPFLALFRQRAGCVEVASSRVIQPIYRLPVCPGDQETVSVHSDLDRMVPKLVPNVGQALPVLDQEASIGVPDGVGLTVAKFRAPKKWTPAVLPEGSGCDEGTFRPGEEPRRDRSPLHHSLGLSECQMRLKDSTELLTHVYTPELVALGRIDAPVAQGLPAAAPRASDPQLAALKIQIVHLERQRFTYPQPCPGQR